MFLIAGLGNPGARYESTRHNIGFMVVERLAARAAAVWKAQFDGQFAQVDIAGQRVGLLKPQTFMNLSGRSLAAAARFYRVEVADVVVVHDELDLAFGDVRLKCGGGEAGHNGLKSITQMLGTAEYVRLRVGIGRPPPEFRGTGADYVLQAFPPEARAEIDAVLGNAEEALITVLRDGVSNAMNQINRRKPR